MGGDATDPLEFPFVVAIEKLCPIQAFVTSELDGCEAPWIAGDLVMRCELLTRQDLKLSILRRGRL